MLRGCNTPNQKLTCFVFSTDLSTDVDQRSQDLRHLYPGMGLQLGVFWFSLTSKLVIRQICMYCDLSMKINTTRREKIVDAFCLCLFPRVCRPKPQYLQLELHDWWRHYMGRCRSSEISGLYRWLYLKVIYTCLKNNMCILSKCPRNSKMALTFM